MQLYTFIFTGEATCKGCEFRVRAHNLEETKLKVQTLSDTIVDTSPGEISDWDVTLSTGYKNG